ncbi:ribonuclease-III-like-domain-containing protein [Apiosordaria backusii]|uniref:Ribonuclease-III-like-domain-containing protein n=1 Tax=Apiosordaria backusii TaxID=314023 RepID=A0AA40ENG4_9PEZI|nr:ribonuclease-III-like-domain-containing protein [Apiosordaria backusii]
MALNPTRSAFSSASKALARCTRPPPQSVASRMGLSARQMSTETTTTTTDTTTDRPPASATSSSERRPRWSYTPERMKGPGFSINIVKNPARKIWHVNEDPEKVDAVYIRLLGKNGDRMLPDEIKWLAVTHKSFDQGRRGFNTRLAYYGRQILALETTRSILVSPFPEDAQDVDFFDEHDREPFQHPALANVDKLYARQPRDVISKEKIAKLAVDVGLVEITRWKPRMPENLELSGIVPVLNTSVLAIVGAISLQHGAEVAHRVVRERILKRLA